MLTLTRKIGESIRIGDEISIVIKEVKGRQVRIGIIAPRDVYVCREELYLKIQRANREAIQRPTVNVENDPLAALGSLFHAQGKPYSPASPLAHRILSIEDVRHRPKESPLPVDLKKNPQGQQPVEVDDES